MTLPEGWFTEQDIKAYKELVQLVPNDSTIYELGTWKGRSICSIAEHIKEKGLTVVLVDTFKGTEGEEEAHKEAKEVDLEQILKENLKSFDILHRCKIIKDKTTSVSVLREATIIKPELVFIDADHSTEAVIIDILSWSYAVSPSGYIAGHDINWRTVQIALKKLGLIDAIQVQGAVWFLPAAEAISRIERHKGKFFNEVTCTISTKDRYFSTLPLVIQSIINQKEQPDYLIVYDDSKNVVDLTKEPLYDNLFYQLEQSNIQWRIVHTGGVGQVTNHQDAFKNCNTKFVWRVDDDLICHPYTLSLLLENINHYGLAAIGPRIVTRGMEYISLNQCSSKLADIYSKPNLQMASLVDSTKRATDLILIIEDVEHLHCSFLYNRNCFDGYCPDLSIVGHREETLFSYQAIQKKHKLGVLVSISCTHLKQRDGGIRDSEVTDKMFEQDERTFRECVGIEIKEKPKMVIAHGGSGGEFKPKRNLAFLDCAVGDHFAFLNCGILLDSEDCTVACCYPEVFSGLKCKIISIEEGKKIIEDNENLFPLGVDGFNVYKFMWDNKWDVKGKTLTEAFKTIYGLYSDFSFC